MKKYTIEPTKENIVKTINEDILGRNEDVKSFYELISAMEDANAIAIDGRWGSGKTFFVKQLELLINSNNDTYTMEENDRSLVLSKMNLSDSLMEKCDYALYYDAWENDNDTDPAMSIIYEIVKELNISYSFSETKLSEVAVAIIKTFEGKSYSKILDSLKSDDPLKLFKEQKQLEDNIKLFFSYILKERGNRLFIIIDELDRCRPDFAVSLLERVKHYFNIENVTFVFSINAEQLQFTIKNHYGEQFDACRYLDRFFDLRINLPTSDKKRFYDKVGVQTSGMTINSTAKKIIEMFNFELREITKFMLQVNVATYNITHHADRFDFSFDDGAGRHLILHYIVPLMIGLRIADINKFNDFIDGKDPSPLQELFREEDTDYNLSPLSDMMNDDETFKQEEGKKIVTQDEISKRAYDAIFIKQYDGRKYQSTIGKYRFDAKSKRLALKAASMIAGYEKLDF